LTISPARLAPQVRREFAVFNLWVYLLVNAEQEVRGHYFLTRRELAALE
jgi:hypothetical protein